MGDLCRESLEAGRILGKHAAARLLRKARLAALRRELEAGRTSSTSLITAAGALTLWPGTTVDLIRAGELRARELRPTRPRLPWFAVDVSSLLVLADELERRREVEDAVGVEVFRRGLLAHVAGKHGPAAADALAQRIRERLEREAREREAAERDQVGP
ncbi:MAG: hypothetical protein WEF99_01395 [Thermoanaerobaculia bacterium]